MTSEGCACGGRSLRKYTPSVDGAFITPDERGSVPKLPCPNTLGTRVMYVPGNTVLCTVPRGTVTVRKRRSRISGRTAMTDGIRDGAKRFRERIVNRARPTTERPAGRFGDGVGPNAEAGGTTVSERLSFSRFFGNGNF